MTAPNAFDPATIKLRADLNEARAVVGFFRPTIRPLLILADGFVLKAAT